MWDGGDVLRRERVRWFYGFVCCSISTQTNRVEEVEGGEREDENFATETRPPPLKNKKEKTKKKKKKMITFFFFDRVKCLFLISLGELGLDEAGGGVLVDLDLFNSPVGLVDPVPGRHKLLLDLCFFFFLITRFFFVRSKKTKKQKEIPHRRRPHGSQNQRDGSWVQRTSRQSGQTSL